MKKMQYLTGSLTLIIALVLFTHLTFAQSSLDKKTLVTIGNEKVSVGEFMRVYEKNNSQTSIQDPSSVDEYLDLFINFKLKVMEAKELQMDTVAAFKEELAGYRQQLAKPYFVDESVNEALLVEAYNRKLKDIRASHILIMVEENAPPEDTLEAYNEILQIREEIMAGKDFAEAAVEYSDDPSARDMEEIPNKQRFRAGNKGDLGYFTVFNMVYPFENGAYETEVGEISQPVRTQYGYHLIQVNDKRDALGKAQVAHIYVALRPNASEEDIAEKRDKINNINAKLKDGATFDDAVILYSEDKGSARNGGLLTPFTCNKVVPEFVLAAESLEIGEVSEPVQTMYGFHIIKLVSRETPGTFEEEAPAIKERLLKDQRAQKSEEVVLKRIKEENNLVINKENKMAALASIDSTVMTGEYIPDSNNTMNGEVMRIGSKKLGKKSKTLSGISIYTQADLLEYIAQNQSPQENIEERVYLENMFQSFVDSKCLEFADMYLEVNYPEFQSLMTEYHDGILLFNLTDEKVWSKAVEDTTGLKEFFLNNNDKYMWGDRVDATIYTVKKKEDVDIVTDYIYKYDNDGDIAQALDADSITSVRITPGKFQKGDNKYIDQVKWTPGVTEITSDVEDLTTIVKIKEVLSPQQKKFEESRGIATADYQEYLEEQWIEQLKEKYPVVINEDVLKQLETSN